MWQAIISSLLAILLAFLIYRSNSRPSVRHNTADATIPSNNEGTANEDSDDSSEEEEDADKRYKMVFVIRMDLEMTKGKIAAQASRTYVLRCVQ